MRYPRDLRDNPQAIASDVLVPMPAGGTVPLGEVAKVDAGARADHRSAPRTASSRPTSTSTSATAISAATSPTRRRRSQASIKFPPGYYVMWSGQFEYLERATARLKIVVPVTLLIIFLLLYLNFRAITETLIVMLSLPFALVGGLWLMWWLGFNCRSRSRSASSRLPASPPRPAS